MDRTGDTLLHCYSAVTDLLQALYISHGLLLHFTNTTLPPKFHDILAFWLMVQTESTYKSKILQVKNL